MKRNSLDPNLEDLPGLIPIFPLDGALLLPGGRLPLNIFEPRYLSMISDALSTPHRLIGMIQTNSSTTQDEMSPMLYSVGCAGRISSFEETLDGRYLISLDGMIRFKVTAEAECGLIIGNAMLIIGHILMISMLARSHLIEAG